MGIVVPVRHRKRAVLLKLELVCLGDAGDQPNPEQDQ